MMNAYYVEYPRDFANEYTVYVTDEPRRFEKSFPDAKRITRREAIRLGWSRPKEAKRDGEQWFGGFSADGYADTVGQAIEECVKATARELEDREMQRATEEADRAAYAR